LRALSTSVASKIEPGSAFPIVACSRAPLFELVQLIKKCLYMHARHDDDNVSMQLRAQAYSSTGRACMGMIRTLLQIPSTVLPNVKIKRFLKDGVVL
jgi:hypothetical protein